MACLGRFFPILLVALLTVSSLIMIESANAQSIPKPSVPEFTVKYVDNSYYISAPTTIIDQNGNSRLVQDYVENKSVEFSIKNQGFTPYTIPYNSSDPYNTGQTVNLMYNIRMKMHTDNTSNWQYITYLSDGYLKQSDSNLTVASYQLENLFSMGIPNNEQIDFQVQALIGYVHRYPITNSWTFNGTESNWSPTQTLAIADESVSPSPTIPEFPYLLVIPLLLSVLAVALAFKIKKPDCIRNK